MSEEPLEDIRPELLRQRVQRPHPLEGEAPLVHDGAALRETLAESVQLHEYTKNSVIRDIVRDFFSESVFGDEPVVPEGVSPVEPVGTVPEEAYEEYGRDVVPVPVTSGRAGVVHLCCILDAPPEEM